MIILSYQVLVIKRGINIMHLWYFPIHYNKNQAHTMGLLKPFIHQPDIDIDGSDLPPYFGNFNRLAGCRILVYMRTCTAAISI